MSVAKQPADACPGAKMELGTTKVGKYTMRNGGTPPRIALEVYSSRAVTNLLMYTWIVNALVMIVTLVEANTTSPDWGTIVLSWILCIILLVVYFLAFWVHIEGLPCDRIFHHVFCRDWTQIDVAASSGLFILQPIMFLSYFLMCIISSIDTESRETSLFVLNELVSIPGFCMFLLFTGGFAYETLNFTWFYLPRILLLLTLLGLRMAMIFGNDRVVLGYVRFGLRLLVYVIGLIGYLRSKKALFALPYLETRFKQIVFRFTTFQFNLTVFLGLFVEVLTFIIRESVDYFEVNAWPTAIIFLYPMLFANLSTVLLIAFLPPNEHNAILGCALDDSNPYEVPWGDVSLALAACSDVYSSAKGSHHPAGTAAPSAAAGKATDMCEGTKASQPMPEGDAAGATEETKEETKEEKKGKKKKTLTERIWKHKIKDWERPGYKCISRVNVPETDANVLIAKIKRNLGGIQTAGWTMKTSDLVVSFRGTGSIKNVVTDLMAYREPIPPELLKAFYRLLPADKLAPQDKGDRGSFGSRRASAGTQRSVSMESLPSMASKKAKKKKKSKKKKLARRASVWVKAEDLDAGDDALASGSQDENVVTPPYFTTAKLHSGFLHLYMSVREQLFKEIDRILLANDDDDDDDDTLLGAPDKTATTRATTTRSTASGSERAPDTANTAPVSERAPDKAPSRDAERIPTRATEATEEVKRETTPADTKVTAADLKNVTDETPTATAVTTAREAVTGAPRKRKILVTGHSLGGALATICALELKSRFAGEYDVQMINVASPRVGNRTFANLFNEYFPEALRIVFDRDVVPGVPKFLFMYKHVGHELFIDAKGNALVDRSPIEKSFVRGGKASFKCHKLPAYRDGVAAYKDKFMFKTHEKLDEMFARKYVPEEKKADKQQAAGGEDQLGNKDELDK